MRCLNVELFDDDLRAHWDNCLGSIRTLDVLREASLSRSDRRQVAACFGELFTCIKYFDLMSYDLILELMSAGQALGNGQFICAPDAMSALQILLDLISYLARNQVVRSTRRRSRKTFSDDLSRVTPE
jgi:hypothetical protein